jgi:hypothetical protein
MNLRRCDELRCHDIHAKFLIVAYSSITRQRLRNKEATATAIQQLCNYATVLEPLLGSGPAQPWKYCLIFQPWTWRYCVSPKRLLSFTGLHVVISLKTALFADTTERTPNLAKKSHFTVRMEEVGNSSLLGHFVYSPFWCDRTHMAHCRWLRVVCKCVMI